MEMTHTPSWIQDLLDSISNLYDTDDPSCIVGYLLAEPDDDNAAFDVKLFPTPSELLGGPQDGAQYTPGFKLGVTGVAALFDMAPEIVYTFPTSWGLEDFDCPSISFSGMYKGRPLVVTLYSDPPEDVEATMLINSETGEAREKQLDETEFDDEDDNELEDWMGGEKDADDEDIEP